eukprot:TRINITY_DN14580_c0_g1_i2.p1 TRINITY_DN14580_c0_g1~~TRINITY_DN14580_c0_g1_i2.p1  ORF type:complete len:348 (+),score=54.09 TRINITY_DN14580_c0_g1_i2:50-1093(+)
MGADMGAGLLWCAIAGIGFGTNFLPVKKVDAGDGIFFSFCMSIGIFATGLLGSFMAKTQDSHAFEGLPRFQPYAMLGGVAWMIGNLMCPLIIKWIGLGLGLTVWDLSNMIMGWVTGRFGLFDVPREHVKNDALNITGFALAVASLFFFSLARDPDCPEGKDSRDPERADREMRHSPSIDSDSSQPQKIKMPQKMRWILGFSMSMFAGGLFGYTFDPAIELAARSGNSKDQMDYVWSNFAGIIITGNIVFVLYVLVRGEKSFIRRSVVIPAILSGVIWAVAQLAWFKANEALSLEIAFPIVSSIPGIVGLLLGVCCFGELKTSRSRLFAGLGCLVRVPGIILIALSGA